MNTQIVEMNMDEVEEVNGGYPAIMVPYYVERAVGLTAGLIIGASRAVH